MQRFGTFELVTITFKTSKQKQRDRDSPADLEQPDRQRWTTPGFFNMVAPGCLQIDYCFTIRQDHWNQAERLSYKLFMQPKALQRHEYIFFLWTSQVVVVQNRKKWSLRKGKERFRSFRNFSTLTYILVVFTNFPNEMYSETCWRLIYSRIPYLWIKDV